MGKGERIVESVESVNCIVLSWAAVAEGIGGMALVVCNIAGLIGSVCYQFAFLVFHFTIINLSRPFPIFSRV